MQGKTIKLSRSLNGQQPRLLLSPADSTASADDEVRRWLRTALGAHAVADLLGGLFLFFWPDAVEVVGLYPPPTNHLLVRTFAAGLLMITVTSGRGASRRLAPTWSETYTMLLGKTAWSLTITVASVIEAIRLGVDTPWVVWLIFGIFLAGFITWTVAGLGGLGRNKSV
jgi:hypothetical protein